MHTNDERPGGIPAAPSKDRVLEHQYDGIQEYDNPTPGWWHWLFWASILFSVLYVMFWHFSDFAWTEHEAYESEVAAYYQMVFSEFGDLEPSQETILMLMHGDPTDSERHEKIMNLQLVAKGTFASKCAACHGATAAGGTGPNLTDDVYLNVKTLEDIADVIMNGAKAGAMPAWKGRLTQNEITLMTAYVALLRGTDLPGKAAEGDAIAPWPEPVAEPE